MYLLVDGYTYVASAGWIRGTFGAWGMGRGWSKETQFILAFTN